MSATWESVGPQFGNYAVPVGAKRLFAPRPAASVCKRQGKRRRQAAKATAKPPEVKA